MKIELPDQDQQQLAAQATAAGYPDLHSYLVDCLHAIAKRGPAGWSYKPGDGELRKSIADLEASHQQALAGDGRDLREALLDIASTHGLKIQR